MGDIIATETEADSPAVVSVAGKPKFLGRPGVCRGRMAIRISGPFEPPKAEATEG
jgi:flagellar motor switch protein FliM